MREVETESSDEYGEEFTMPKTRQQKMAGNSTAAPSKPAAKPEKAAKKEPAAQ